MRDAQSRASAIRRLLHRIDRATDRVLGSPDGRWTLASTLMTGSVVATVTWMALAATPPSSRLYEPGHEQVVVPTDLLTRLAEAASGSPAAAAPAAGPGLDGEPSDRADGPGWAGWSSSPAQPLRRSSSETRTLQFKSGDTIMEVLQDAGVSTEDATAVVDAMRPLYNPRNIRAGQTFEATFGPAPESDRPASDRLHRER